MVDVARLPNSINDVAVEFCQGNRDAVVGEMDADDGAAIGMQGKGSGRATSAGSRLVRLNRLDQH